MKLKPLLWFLECLVLASCGGDEDNPIPDGINPRQEMRDFVAGISQYSKSIREGFLIVPQNGIELVSQNGEEDGPPVTAYLDAIDGNGQEDLLYGYDEDDRATPTVETEYLKAFLDISKDAGNTILVTDYCSTPSKMDDSYSRNQASGYVSFAADERELDNIPSHPLPINSENELQIQSLSQVRNFLYLINPDNFPDKADFIQSISSTNYDLLIMDLFFQDGTALTAEETQQLRSKANGGSRLLLCYLSIGEAEDYRYYWESGWNSSKPSWMDKENPDWEGNYKVWYWEQEWQDIIFGNEGSYLKKILDAGFDGVYLDIIDAYEYYE